MSEPSQPTTPSRRLRAHGHFELGGRSPSHASPICHRSHAPQRPPLGWPRGGAIGRSFVADTLRRVRANRLIVAFERLPGSVRPSCTGPAALGVVRDNDGAVPGSRRSDAEPIPMGRSEGPDEFAAITGGDVRNHGTTKLRCAFAVAGGARPTASSVRVDSTPAVSVLLPVATLDRHPIVAPSAPRRALGSFHVRPAGTKLPNRRAPTPAAQIGRRTLRPPVRTQAGVERRPGRSSLASRRTRGRMPQGSGSRVEFFTSSMTA